MITVATDREGLRQAALELFEEELEESRRRKLLEQVRGEANRARILDEPRPERTLAQGYYGRAEYLFLLARLLKLGVQFTLRDLDHDEVIGLDALDAARTEFGQKHPGCPHCGEPLGSRFSTVCELCGEAFKRKGGAN